MKILLLDDAMATAQMLAIYLQAQGCTVTVAADGELGLEYLTQNMPDVILLDWCMPFLDGAGFLKRLRAEPRWQEIPVVVLTALGTKEIADLEGQWPGLRIMQKPLTPEEIHRALECIAGDNPEKGRVT